MTLHTNIKAGINEITFATKTIAGDLMLAGLLFVPEDFEPNNNYPAVIFSQPFNQVKEQTGAVYGRHLAEKGYITLVLIMQDMVIAKVRSEIMRTHS
jgi:hypothetical protein